MESLSSILEEELTEAVQVKSQKSLHRYITILTENLAREDRNERQHAEFRENFLRLENRIDLGLVEMKEGFKRMDERFEAVDKRFEAMQQQMDRRFEAVDKRFESIERQFNKRFSMMFTFMSLGFILLATLMSVYQFL